MPPMFKWHMSILSHMSLLGFGMLLLFYWPVAFIKSMSLTFQHHIPLFHGIYRSLLSYAAASKRLVTHVSLADKRQASQNSCAIGCVDTWKERVQIKVEDEGGCLLNSGQEQPQCFQWTIFTCAFLLPRPTRVQTITDLRPLQSPAGHLH